MLDVYLIPDDSGPFASGYPNNLVSLPAESKCPALGYALLGGPAIKTASDRTAIACPLIQNYDNHRNSA